MSQGWYLTLISSALCISGCLVVFLDDLYTLLLPRFITKRFPFVIKENYKFMNASLAFSSGCLIFTALYRLLPEALSYLQGDEADASSKINLSSERQLHIKLFAGYIGGIILSLTFNALLHLATSESVFHCSDHDQESGEPDTSCVNHDEDESYSTADHTERSHLLSGHAKRSPFFHLLGRQKDGECIEGECKGYSSAELCLYHGGKRTSLHFCEIPALSPPEESDFSSDTPILAVTPQRSTSDQNRDGPENESSQDHHSSSQGEHEDTQIHSVRSHSHSHSHHHGHHHHVNSAFSKLFLIGVQTILAITLHKFPEGFITYLTSETNPQLGVLIFISLLFHNFTEGFLMCLPLYYLFASSQRARYAKLKAVTVSAFLGGISQPLGALGAILFLKINNAMPGDADLDVDKLNSILGVTLAVTSGFLTVIGLSMYGSAVAFSGGSLHLIMVWCLVGMSVIGISSVISVK